VDVLFDAAGTSTVDEDFFKVRVRDRASRPNPNPEAYPKR